MNNENQSETTENAAKKKVRRKPAHVFVPIALKEMSVLADDGLEMTVRVVPDGVIPYVAHVIEGGEGQTDAIRDVLKGHSVDLSNLGDVLLFRADPVDFELRMNPQLILRPRKG